MKKRAIYYYTAWSTYGRNFQIKDIPDEVTDICYAFYNVDSSGNVFSGDAWADTDKRFVGEDSVHPPDTWNDTNSNAFYGNFGQIKKLQEKRKRENKEDLKVQLSIGGWTWSKYFSDAVSTDAKRRIFVNSLISIFKKYPIFNGVSIDWEYPSTDGVNYGNEGNVVRREDGTNLVIFIKMLREAFLQNRMGHFKIALCCTAAPEKAKFNVEEIHPIINEFHCMSYDYEDGNWGGKIAAHHTNPRKSKFSKPGYSCEEAADYYISRGVPAEKIFIGAAFYSRGFGNCEGLGKIAEGGSPDSTWEKGVVDYKDLPKEGAKEFIDKESMACFSYDPVKKIFNSYDNPISIKEKCKIVHEKNLGGIIVWELSGDRRPTSSSRSLVKALSEGLAIVGNNEPGIIVPPQGIPLPANEEVSNNPGKKIKVSFELNTKDNSVSNFKCEDL